MEWVLGEAVTLETQVKRLIAFYGGAREASRQTDIAYSYLRAIRDGAIHKPRAEILTKLGLKVSGTRQLIFRLKRIPK